MAAEGFGRNSSNYEANRPGYTPEAVKIIAQAVASVSSIGKGIQCQVLELGAGTGKLTEQLVRELPTSTRYLASEPSRNFLDALREKSLGVETVETSAASIPLPDNSVQAVVCAQSFHWFSDLDSLNSIHRALAPAGLLILVWNKKNLSDDGWHKKLTEMFEEVIERTGANRRYVLHEYEWREDVDQSGLFSLSQRYDLPGFDFHGSMENLLAMTSTVSAFNALPQDEREGYLDRLREMFKATPGLDLENLRLPHKTDLFVYVRQA